MSLDLLNLNKSDKVRKILQKHTDGILFDEVILYSNTVQKINRKSKLQQRILVITDKAIYNFTPGTPIGKLKRRISLKQIDTISISSCLNITDIVLHIPTEYDYLYRLSKKQDINQIIHISQEYANKLAHEINILIFELDNLSLISDNDKSKIKKNESPKQYMERKIIKWKQKYNVKNYQHHKSISKQKISENNFKTSKYTSMSNISNTSYIGIDNGLSPLIYMNNNNEPESFMLNINIIHPQHKTSFEQKENINNNGLDLEKICQTDSECYETSECSKCNNNNKPQHTNINNIWDINDTIQVYSHSKAK